MGQVSWTSTQETILSGFRVGAPRLVASPPEFCLTLEKALQIRVAGGVATEREVPMQKPAKASLLGTSPTHLTQNGCILGFQWD